MSELRVVTVTLNPAVDRVLEAPDFAVGGHSQGRRVALYPAGKGVNVSRVMASLGRRSICAGFVGHKELGMFEEYLERVGQGRIVTQLMVVRGATRDNITIVDPINDTETHLRERGFTAQREDVRRITSKLGMLAREGTIIALSGSTPLGMTPGDYVEIVRRCRRQGAHVCIDTSGPALEALREQPVWMAKLNQKELRTLSGKDTDTLEQVIEASKALASTFGGPVDHVAATMGELGTVLITPQGAWRAWAAIHPGLILSTVGCGDALLAGLFSVLQRSSVPPTGDQWREALTEGVAAASINATMREAGHIDPAKMPEFRELVEVEPL
ncbi:MAG: 1-phosphofructokinase family hexose kinase [Phycisphaerales bacterium]